MNTCFVTYNLSITVSPVGCARVLTRVAHNIVQMKDFVTTRLKRDIPDEEIKARMLIVDDDASGTLRLREFLDFRFMLEGIIEAPIPQVRCAREYLRSQFISLIFFFLFSLLKFKSGNDAVFLFSSNAIHTIVAPYTHSGREPTFSDVRPQRRRGALRLRLTFEPVDRVLTLTVFQFEARDVLARSPYVSVCGRATEYKHYTDISIGKSSKSS
jgi:hypothetical protein